MGAMPRNVDSVSMVARVTICQKNQARDVMGGQENVAVRFPELIAVLLGMAEVEVLFV